MIKDILGREIVEGCAVLRAKHSSFTIHKVLGFTDRSIILSVKKLSSSRRVWGQQGMTDFTYTADTSTVAQLPEHNSKMYFDKRYSKIGLILAI